MARYSEPTPRQVEMARAFLFLAETKRALRNQGVRDAVLELDVDSNIHNQDPDRSIYHVHATRGELRITVSKGRAVRPISDTPYTVARMLAADARKATKQQAEAAAARNSAAA
jgi:hypothetical protein